MYMIKYIAIILLTSIIIHDNHHLVASNYKYQYNTPLNKTDAVKITQEIFNNYKEHILQTRLDEMEDHYIRINDKEMKFSLKSFGSKPEGGWSLYISLHGGGGVADSVNESQWNRHHTLYTFKEGIVLIPRSPTNTWNMWHQDHIDLFFNRLIQNMISLHSVDPNRIYLMGYSAGGDGVYQVAPRMADRFAAAAMMAGHPNETSPLGLRNVGFTIHMGENDSAYNRNKVALEWKNQLKILKENDIGGYQHSVVIHKNKGHWMGGLDTSAISWISMFNRNPYPKKVVWKQDDVTHKRFYWLRVNKPLKNSLIKASIIDQNIYIEESTVSDLIICLNDDLINMDETIIVEYLGNEVFSGIVPRDVKIISRSISEYGDPESVFFGELSLSLDQ